MSVVNIEPCGLSAETRAIFFDVIEPTEHINDREQFFRWTQTELQRIFPHGMLMCGVGNIDKNGVRIRHVMGCNFPQEYLQTLQRQGGLTQSPMLAQWVQQRQPILFDPDNGSIVSAAHSAWLENFRRFGLINLAAHGQCDAESTAASYFSFSCIPGRLSPHHAIILKLLVPHLHIALTRVVSNLPASKSKPAPKKLNLSPRENEILEWLGRGKTNWEIAQLLGIKESTVKKHVHNVLTSLNVNSRTQAVTKAIGLKLPRTMRAV